MIMLSQNITFLKATRVERIETVRSRVVSDVLKTRLRQQMKYGW